MFKSRSRGLTVAPVPRRLAAGAIDAAVIFLPVLAVSAGAAALHARRRRRAGEDPEPCPAFTVPGRWQTVFGVGGEVVQLAALNQRGPGYRALGLRRADVRTGGPVSLRGALIYGAVMVAFRRLTQLGSRPFKRRIEAARADFKAVQRAHPDDPKARHEALREVYSRHRVNPATACAPALVGAVVTQAPALWSPLNQTLAERLAGIVVVVED